jgi:hypothetical protein
MDYWYLGSIFRGPAPHWGDNRILPYLDLRGGDGHPRARADRLELLEHQRLRAEDGGLRALVRDREEVEGLRVGIGRIGASEIEIPIRLVHLG